MIKSVHFALLTPNQLFSLSEGTLALFQASSLSDGPAAPFITKLSDSQDDFSKAFKRDDKSPYTEQKALLDSERDEGFFAFRGFVEASTHRKNPEFSEPAHEIYEVIRRYGWSSWSEGYQKQSAIFANMLEELETNMSGEMDAIGATLWFQELKVAQQAFNDVKMESVSNTVDPVTLTETRTPLEQSLRNLYSMTDLLAQTEESGTFNQLILDLNELIGQIMSVARAAQTRKENQQSVDPDQN